jgi:putative FmdB family regulatory protein
MPIYEYECAKCGHEFEREQRMSDPPVKTCPKCKGRKVTKLISRSSFVLKGGGWYADGYSDPGKKKGAGDSSESSSSGDDSSEKGKSSSSDKPKSDDKPKSKGGDKGGGKGGAKNGSSKSAA